MTYRKVLKAAYLVPFALLLLGCFKVKPGPYQIALTRYYRTLQAPVSDEKLTASISGVTGDLKKSPSDANMILLRTSARLDRLRLKMETTKKFEPTLAQEFFDDLRLLQNVLDKPGNRPFWLNARVMTMFGDALLLASQIATGTGEAAIRNQIVEMGLFQLAADSYLRAATRANSDLAAAGKGGADQANQLPALGQELSNAREGYVTALTGLAQSKIALSLGADARADLLNANAVSSGGDFPPKNASAAGFVSLYSEPHRTAQVRAAALEQLTPDNFADRRGFAELRVREEIAAGLLGTPTQEVSASTIQSSLSLAGVYATATIQAVNPKIIGSGDLATESIEFTLRSSPPYSAVDIDAPVRSLTIRTPDADTVVLLTTNNPRAPFSVNKTGIHFSIHSGAGNNAVTADQPVKYFLNQKTAFTKGQKLTLLGPAGNVLAEVVP